MKRGKKGIAWSILFWCFVAVFSVAFLGSILTSQGLKDGWYASVKPAITPPNWVFPIVWTFLFVLITISLYISLVSIKNKKITLKIYYLFGINFLLNVLWTFFYFCLRKPALAYFDLILLMISIAILISFTWRINKKSAWLLIPYLLWVGFAGILNYLSAFA
jgi:tryptophan-rich sensory protein